MLTGIMKRKYLLSEPTKCITEHTMAQFFLKLQKIVEITKIFLQSNKKEKATISYRTVIIKKSVNFSMLIYLFISIR